MRQFNDEYRKRILHHCEYDLTVGVDNLDKQVRDFILETTAMLIKSTEIKPRSQTVQITTAIHFGYVMGLLEAGYMLGKIKDAKTN